jgi:hypothetical protein
MNDLIALWIDILMKGSVEITFLAEIPTADLQDRK